MINYLFLFAALLFVGVICVLGWVEDFKNRIPKSPVENDKKRWHYKHPGD